MTMNKKMINKSSFRTKDIFISSTLYALGEKLDSSEWVDNECFFIFEDESSCSDIVKKYYSGELKADPRIIFDSFKTIKSILFNK